MKRVFSDPNGVHTIDTAEDKSRRVMHVIFEPGQDDTKVGIWIHHVAGRDRADRLLWSGRLPMGVPGLRGRSGLPCAILLCRLLLDAEPRADSDRHPEAVGPGAPLGATGGPWTEPPLPGM